MISFIIPAFNEEHLLGRTLDSIQNAAKKLNEAYEMIVVDDDSSDKTGEIARGHGAEVVQVKHKQISASRNSGTRIAKGDYLIFVDADTVVSAEILEEAISALRRGAVGGGAAFEFDGWVPLYGRVLQWLVYHLYHLGKVASGSFMFCTKDAFDRVGGFDEKLYGSEEAVMSRALRRCGRFVVLKQAVLTSGRKLRMHSFWEIMAIMGRVILAGGRISNRQAARIWYDGKRETVK